MADLKTALSEAFAAVEETPVEAPAVQETPATFDAETGKDVTAEARARDEKGRFAAEQKAERAPDSPSSLSSPNAPAAPQGNAGTAGIDNQAEAPVVPRPSTWKKEYWPLYDKLYTGQPLTADEAKRIAEYTNERENQFKSGVSTYKAEADKAKELQDALAPFMPELQRYNIAPGQWIANLGRAHQTLALGSPTEKVQMFQRLAKEYGVPLESIGAEQASQVDPNINWLQQELQGVKSSLQQFQTLQQQQEQQALQAEIARVQNEKDASGRLVRPHWDQVRDQMSGLLQSGMAQDLADAYTKAVRLNDSLWDQQRQLATPSAQQAAAAVQKAKAAAVSPKSASPSVTGDAQPKGLRANLEARFDAAMGGGRV